MARARNIKPAFFLNTDLADNSPLGRLAFIGMWTIADYKGCIEFNAKKIKAQILPYDDCNMEEITINLDKSGFVSIYSVQGKRYIKILNFERHQNPHKNEREAGSELPDIDKNDNSFSNLQNIKINLEQDGTTRADSLIPHPDSPIPISEKVSRINALDNGFLEFWNLYPKKVGKDKALIAWNKKKPKIDDVIFALEWQKVSRQWSDGFIPNPTTYINEGRWKDEPQERKVAF